jgi:uncharacterized membrane protein YqjE
MDSPPPAGFVSSLRTLGDGLLAGAEDRLKLLSLELQEEKYRLIQTFIWICAAAFVGMMTIVLASLALVWCFPPESRLAALGGLTLLYAAALAALLLGLRRFLARQPEPFAATLQEIAEDRACIRPGT